MLNHPTLDQLKTMRLHGMAQAFEEQLHHSNADALSFDDRLAFLVEREHTLRANRQLTNRLRRAKLKLQATLEDLDLHARRGLDKNTPARTRHRPLHQRSSQHLDHRAHRRR